MSLTERLQQWIDGDVSARYALFDAPATPRDFANALDTDRATFWSRFVKRSELHSYQHAMYLNGHCLTRATGLADPWGQDGTRAAEELLKVHLRGYEEALVYASVLDEHGFETVINGESLYNAARQCQLLRYAVGDGVMPRSDELVWDAARSGRGGAGLEQRARVTVN